MPAEITQEVVEAVLTEHSKTTLAAAISRARAGGSCFEYKFGRVDRDALHEHQAVLRQLLLKNAIAIFKKSTCLDAIQSFDAKLGQPLSHGTFDRLRAETYAFVHMFQVLRRVKRTMRGGARVPRFLVDLTNLIEDAPTLQCAGASRAPSAAGVELKPPRRCLGPSAAFQLMRSSWPARPAGRPLVVDRLEVAAQSPDTPSSTSTETEFLPAVTSPRPSTAGRARAPLPCARVLRWFDYSRSSAVRLAADGGEVLATDHYCGDDGMAMAVFEGEPDWNCGIPYLLVFDDDNDAEVGVAVRKRPAGAAVTPEPKRAKVLESGAKARKNLFSRVYHRALTEEKKSAASYGWDYCHVEAKATAREAARAACAEAHF